MPDLELVYFAVLGVVSALSNFVCFAIWIFCDLLVVVWFWLCCYLGLLLFWFVFRFVVLLWLVCCVVLYFDACGN